MIQKRERRIFAIAALLALLVGLVTACQKSVPIVGRWRTTGPANLLYEYREDGTVILIEETRSYQMFRYQLKEGHILHLYDGLGRRQVYRYEIEGDKMTYYQTTGSGAEVEEVFRRERGQ